VRSSVGLDKGSGTPFINIKFALRARRAPDTGAAVSKPDK
jgi:hypothetical protein